LLTDYQRQRTHAARSPDDAASAVTQQSSWASRLFISGFGLVVIGLVWAAFSSSDPARNVNAASSRASINAAGEPVADIANEDTTSSQLFRSLLKLPIPIASLTATERSRDILLFADDWLRRGDTPSSVLNRLGVTDDSFDAWARQSPEMRAAFASTRNTRATVGYLPDVGVRQFIVRWPDSAAPDHFSRLTVTRRTTSPSEPTDANQDERATATDSQATFTATLESVPLTRVLRLASGVISSSLFATTDAQDIPDAVAMNLAEIFSNDIDFNRDLRKGDSFAIAYEVLEADHEPLETGRVVAASFINKGQEHQAIWYQNGKTKDYFTPKGESTRRFYLGSPMAFSRVTSGFAMRYHPVLKTKRRHLGVDYGAPTGTPVRTVGDGKVVFAGRKGGYGNVIEVQHDSRNRTLYAHLSRIFVKRGQRVERGDNIGAVGTTGLSTGPHLHFEHRVNGVHKNPALLAKNSRARTIPSKDMPAFENELKIAQTQLAAAREIRTASAE
jgi:murein DD-endopeptidase MepM/ murein hydrolase activator NlpD